MQRSTLTLNQHKLLMSMPKSFTASGQGDAGKRVPRLAIDINPSVGRLSTSTLDDGMEISPCILPQQILWLHLPSERIMLGYEAMLLQG